jgi:hypothetical protein
MVRAVKTAAFDRDPGHGLEGRPGTRRESHPSPSENTRLTGLQPQPELDSSGEHNDAANGPNDATPRTGQRTHPHR